MPLHTPNKKKGSETMLIRCSCGRNKFKKEYDDLYVIIEQDGYTANGKAVSTSLVVCTRKGCRGMWRSDRGYVSSLPRLYWKDYDELTK